MTTFLTVTCPVCGRERVDAFDTDLFGEEVQIPDELLHMACWECISRSHRTDWSRAVFEARWTAWHRHFPTLHGADDEAIDRAYVLRDGEVRELEKQLSELSITPEKREQIVNGFVCEHTDAAFWLTTEFPAAELLEALGA